MRVLGVLEQMRRVVGLTATGSRKGSLEEAITVAPGGLGQTELGQRLTEADREGKALWVHSGGQM